MCDKIDWMENGWIGLSGCGKWMWKVEGGAVPDLTYVSHLIKFVCLFFSFFVATGVPGE